MPVLQSYLLELKPIQDALYLGVNDTLQSYLLELKLLINFFILRI